MWVLEFFISSLVAGPAHLPHLQTPDLHRLGKFLAASKIACNNI